MEQQAPRIFTPEYYRRLAQAEQHNAWSAHMQRLAFALLDRCGGGRPLDRVLDAGCGAGYFTQLWRDRGRIRVAVGLDVSLDALVLSHARGMKQLATGSVTALPFRAGQFDAVYCADVLQHLGGSTAGETLAEFARVLQARGLLLIRAAARRGIGAKKHRDTPDYQQWEPEKLRAMLVERGFHVEWISLVNWLPSLAADLRAHGRPAPAGDVGLPGGAATGGGLRDGTLAAYWRLESFVLLRLGWKLPGGHTVLCVARKL